MCIYVCCLWLEINKNCWQLTNGWRMDQGCNDLGIESMVIDDFSNAYGTIYIYIYCYHSQSWVVKMALFYPHEYH